MSFFYLFDWFSGHYIFLLDFTCLLLHIGFGCFLFPFFNLYILLDLFHRVYLIILLFNIYIALFISLVRLYEINDHTRCLYFEKKRNTLIFDLIFSVLLLVFYLSCKETSSVHLALFNILVDPD